jgi:uncharacterized protein YkwD
MDPGIFARSGFMITDSGAIKSKIGVMMTKFAVSAILFFLLASSVATAAPSSCEQMAKEVLVEINLARKDPRGYAEYLRGFRARFRGHSYRLQGTNILVRTREGVKGVNGAIRFLSRQSPLPPLSWSDGLADAAAELAQEEGRSGDVGHRGKNSGGPRERIERHGEWRGSIGESIFYGPGDARQVVMGLITDDGVPDRGHRKDIFSKTFRRGGVACGPHPVFETVCVIDFAVKFLDK